MTSQAPPLKWLDQATYDSLPIQEQSLMWAAYYCDVKHVHEEPKGSNRGPNIDQWAAYCGFPHSGEPWCMMLQTWVHHKVGWEHFKSASVHGWYDWAVKHHLLYDQPRRGDTGVRLYSASTGHGVAVTSAHGLTFSTIEGNSNDDGEREGYEVCRLERPIKGWKFIRWYEFQG